MRLAAAMLVLVLAIGACRDRGSPTAPATAPDTLLSSGRIAALPAGDRGGWQSYVDSSKAVAGRDLAAVQAEARTVGRSSWIAAPVGPDFALTPTMAGAWFATAEARRIAGVIVSYQTPAGGWSKAVDMTASPRPQGVSYSSTDSWSWIGTFDNGATTEELRFLGAEAMAQSDTSATAAFNQGLAYIFRSQFPNGCWPQVYPLAGSYHDAVTFNDNAIVRVLRLLRSVAAGDYTFVSAASRATVDAAYQHGIACILAAQVTDQGTKTVWGQQQDPLTLVPVKARAYEPASLTAGESAGVMDFLMELPSPDASVVTAVKAAAAWFRKTAIYGSVWTNGTLVAQNGAGPLWARFYQLGTGRPIFGDRDGSIYYDVRQVSEERRLGYAWYVNTAVGTLARYDKWAPLHP